MTALFNVIQQLDPTIKGRTELLFEIGMLNWVKAQNQKMTIALAQAAHRYDQLAATPHDPQHTQRKLALQFLRMRILKLSQDSFQLMELYRVDKILKITTTMANKERDKLAALITSAVASRVTS